MQFRNSRVFRSTVGAKFATGIFLAASVLFAAYAQTPSRFANDTFTVITRTDGGRVRMHLEGRGDHCWATSSDDHSVDISMGDDLCTSSPQNVPDDAVLFARVTPNKISFRLNGKSYAISDANTVKSARTLFDPLVNIEAQQYELGTKQRALGEKQREFGRQQREVKVHVPDMSAEFQRVEADAKRLSTQGGTQSELGDLQSELGDLQSRIGDLQSQAGDQQSKIGDQQSQLGDQQSQLGDQQSELAEKGQALVMTISGKLRDLLMQAVNSGAAKAD